MTRDAFRDVPFRFECPEQCELSRIDNTIICEGPGFHVNLIWGRFPYPVHEPPLGYTLTSAFELPTPIGNIDVIEARRSLMAFVTLGTGCAGLVAAVVLILSLVVFVPRIGVTGAIIATVATSALAFAVSFATLGGTTKYAFGYEGVEYVFTFRTRQKGNALRIMSTLTFLPLSARD